MSWQKNKNVDNKITIQDIVDNCGYSPATFYRNFRDKYDLIYVNSLPVQLHRYLL